MKILMLESSGNKNGSSNMLAKEFIRGAKENGNEIMEFDVIHSTINDCLGCQACAMNGPCVRKDDYELKLKPMIKEADMLVFVMPVYYYNWPSQLKKVVDRFYSYTMELTNMHKKAVILSVAWDSSIESFNIVKDYFHKITNYMQMENVGEIYGLGCGTPGMTAETEFPKKAYELGKSIR